MNSAKPSAASKAIVSRIATVDGLKLRYLTAGHGPALILLHGYTQTSRMWRPIIPSFAQKFTVIAPDLPGIGDSGIPADGPEEYRTLGHRRESERNYGSFAEVPLTRSEWYSFPSLFYGLKEEVSANEGSASFSIWLSRRDPEFGRASP